MLTLLADVVWPALFLEMRLLSWWVILAGLLVEWPFVRMLTHFAWSKAFIANVAMNGVSTIIGIVLLPVVGFGWEYLAEVAIYRFWDVGTFNPFGWAATFVLAAALNSAIELSVLRLLFKQRLGQRGFWWLCLANSLSVALALCSIFHSPPQT